MASIYSNISANKRKTFFLMLAFTAMFLLLGYAVSEYTNSIFPAIASLSFAAFANFSAFWFSDKLALASVSATPADEHEHKELHRILENLAITAGLPKPKLYIIKDAAPNAFATGRNPNNASVAVTEGLLRMLDKSELEAVLAHELSHIGNRDILVMSVAAVLVGTIAYLADIAMRASFYSAGDSKDGKASPLLFWLMIVAAILLPIAAQLMHLAVSRKREFLADSSAALLTRYPDALASALVKISSYQAPMKKANHATAHMFISNPFGAKDAGSWIGKLFSTHPPVEERVRALVGDRADKFLQTTI